MRFRATLVTLLLAVSPVTAMAQSGDLIVEKKTFELPSYTTVAGETIKNVKIGWQAAGTLNADKSNAILITHFFSGTSHAFGKYAPTDNLPGYWDAIIGPGKAVDTNKYYVLSSDTLVNLNVKHAERRHHRTREHQSGDRQALWHELSRSSASGISSRCRRR